MRRRIWEDLPLHLMAEGPQDGEEAISEIRCHYQEARKEGLKPPAAAERAVREMMDLFGIPLTLIILGRSSVMKDREGRTLLLIQRDSGAAAFRWEIFERESARSIGWVVQPRKKFAGFEGYVAVPRKDPPLSLRRILPTYYQTREDAVLFVSGMDLAGRSTPNPPTGEETDG